MQKFQQTMVARFDRAKKLIKCAKINGADAVKLQTYSPETMTIKSKKNILKYKMVYGRIDIYGSYTKKLKHHLVGTNPFFDYAKKIKILIFSTPFDETSVDLLEKLNCPIYKVASCEMTDLPLIKKIAKTKKTYDYINRTVRFR